MAYAVVNFIDDDLTSEIPTNWLHKDGDNYMCWWPPLNTKNTKLLIMKRAEPNIKTWMLLSISVEKYCETFEKARKIAEDKDYTSTEDSKLGKGCRKKIPASRYINPDTDSDTDSLSNERSNDNNNKNQAISSINLQFTKGNCKKKSNKNLDANTIQEDNNAVSESHSTSKLPDWPFSRVNSRNENTCFVPTDGIINLENTFVDETCIKHNNISRHQSLPHTSSFQSTAENQFESYNLVHDNSYSNKELTKCVRDIRDKFIYIRIYIYIKVKKKYNLNHNTLFTGNTEILIRMCASFELQIKDILQHINKLTPNMLRINASTERVKNILPLKSIDEINTIEALLQEESFMKEYKTFILKIGGHSPRETIRNVFSRIFSNECSINVHGRDVDKISA